MTFPSDAHSIVIPQAAGPQEKLSEYPGLSVPPSVRYFASTAEEGKTDKS